MLNLDYGRQTDLKDLEQAIRKAKSIKEREHYERIAYQIINELAPVQSLRTELIKAFRGGDSRRVQQIQEHIQRVKLEHSYGKNWGNNKGNKV